MDPLAGRRMRSGEAAGRSSQNVAIRGPGMTRGEARYVTQSQHREAAMNLARSPRPAGSAWAREKRCADVLGRQMAYIERGEGHPIVFLHGNPTSSFLWRNVLPFVEAAGRRLIVPDLIGMGDSDKILAGAERDRYRSAGHARYLGAFMDEVAGTEPVTLVLHDWGGALGFDWTYRHQQRVRAIAYMETFVAPLTLQDLPAGFRPTLQAVRSPVGEALVLEENMFIEKVLPGVTQRALSADEMAEYRRPFQEAGDDRWPTFSLTSTASPWEVSTSCRRTVPTRSDRRSPTGSSESDGRCQPPVSCQGR